MLRFPGHATKLIVHFVFNYPGHAQEESELSEEQMIRYLREIKRYVKRYVANLVLLRNKCLFFKKANTYYMVTETKTFLICRIPQIIYGIVREGIIKIQANGEIAATKFG